MRRAPLNTWSIRSPSLPHHKKFPERRILQDISNVQASGKSCPGKTWKGGVEIEDRHDTTNDQQTHSTLEHNTLEWRVDWRDSFVQSPGLMASLALSKSVSTQPPGDGCEDITAEFSESPQAKSNVKDIIDFIDQVSNILDKSTHDRSTIDELLMFMDQAVDKIKVLPQEFFCSFTTQNHCNRHEGRAPEQQNPQAIPDDPALLE